MHDVLLLVEVPQCENELHEDVPDALLAEAQFLLSQRLAVLDQRRTFDELHHDEEFVRALERLDVLDNVRVVQLVSYDLHFVVDDFEVLGTLVHLQVTSLK